MSVKPCEWPIYYQTGECDCDALQGLDPERRRALEDLAVTMLWAWTGRRLGLCDVTVRPCRAECAPAASTFWGGPNMARSGWMPVLVGGEWFNVTCGACSTAMCSCAPDAARALRLPGPVASIESVWVGGAILPESAYKLRDGVLYRTDGGVWPACNDEIADPEAPESAAWQVTYKRGIPVPESGQIATGILACELAKAACRDKTCQLPQRVQSVTRQGVSVAVLDSFEDLKDGRTGIWLIDSWVAAMNAPVPVRPQVFSPDIAPGRGSGTWQGLGRGRTW